MNWAQKTPTVQSAREIERKNAAKHRGEVREREGEKPSIYKLHLIQGSIAIWGHTLELQVLFIVAIDL